MWLIPAHAGSTALRPPRGGPSGAHPRSRGEHFGIALQFLSIVGSSPLTRGAPERGGRHAHHQGLIPAHAGSTFLPCVVLRWCWAHPRSRGEHALAHEFERLVQGSSPLTRGAPTLGRHSLGHRRLIPAHAGSTGCCSPGPARPRAHPRSRGEHKVPIARVEPGEGSSPLTRGARRRRRRSCRS